MRRTTHRLVAVSSIGALLVGGAPRQAWADPSEADRALATALFQEGRALLEKGRVAEACSKLEESQRLDPGGGTLLNLALCHEREGKVATAWSEFTEALGMAKRDGRQLRQQIAEQHISAIEKALPRLVIAVPADADLPDLEIKRDGTVVGRPAWGTPMPIDPGDHLVAVSATGKKSIERKVTIESGGKVETFTVPKLEDAPQSATSAGSAVPGAAGAPGGAPGSVGLTVNGAAFAGSAAGTGAGSDRAAARGGAGQRFAGFLALGLGVGGLGAGSYFGLQALSNKKDAKQLCGGGGPSDPCHSQEGVDRNHDALRAADLATVGFGIGVVGVAAGLYLLLTAPSTAHAEASAEAKATEAKATDDGAQAGAGANRGTIDIVPVVTGHETAVSVAGTW